MKRLVLESGRRYGAVAMLERNRIAETLRNVREQRGLAIEDAARDAGIPGQYLRLLEGESNVRIGVSDELYLVPFFRKYARFLGLNAEELLPEFLGAVQQIPPDGSPPIRLAYRSRLSSLWRPTAVLATIALAAFLMLRQQSHRAPIDDQTAAEHDDAPVAATATPGAAAVIAVASPDASAPEPSTTPQPEQSSSTSTTAPSAHGSPAATPATSPGVEPPPGAHQLTLHATEDAWFSLTIDDQPAKEYLLHAGDSRTWTAARLFTLTVGNAGGVALTLDGRDLPPIGPAGKVVRNLHLPAEAAQ